LFGGLVELLLANGAEVNAKDGVGWTPMHAAAEHGQDGIAELLRQHGGHK
jgi:ankyrin repeat protein